ncbi:MAG TPA: HAD hydrolase-like protein [Clostridia bacterium]|nr:HAD hydrolase-like protein [Clostridia bacterium]
MNTIFFDYDGCIHDSLIIYAPAFRKAQEYFVGLGLADERFWPESEIRQWIGQNPKEMWQRFRLDLPKDIRKIASTIIGEHMLSIIETAARLYPRALATLGPLKVGGYSLVLISNCRKSYLNTHNKVFSLDRYFEKLICSETWHFASKTAIFAQVVNEYHANYAIVGDREVDIEAGKFNNMIAIAARYGYAHSSSELEKADLLIDNIEDRKYSDCNNASRFSES